MTFVVAGSWMGTARGGTCPDAPTSPEDWSDSDVACSVGPASTDICAVSAGVYVCDLDQGDSATQGGVVHLVSDMDGGTTKLQAFGVYNGTLFCCTTSTTNVDHAKITGSKYGDVLNLSFDNGSVALYLHRTPDGSWTDDIDIGEIQGNGGNDYLVGSPETDASYRDNLDGGDGNDTIHGADGYNYMYGEDGADAIFGGAESTDSLTCGHTSTHTDSNSMASAYCTTDLSTPPACP